MKPLGVSSKMCTVRASSPAYSARNRNETLTMRATNLPYLSATHSKQKLKPLKNHPKSAFQMRVKRSGLSWWRSIIAQSAGESVSETTPERIVETAIVSANCL